MQSKEALAARIAVLENIATVLARKSFTKDSDPVVASVQFYHAIHEMAVDRYKRAQPGPELIVAESALNATHRFYERLID